jgi:hypothetical protein
MRVLAKALLQFVLAVSMATPLTAGEVERSALNLEQVFPRIAGKNLVRWYGFDWKYLRYNPAATGAAVKLFYYEGEESIAKIARPLISEAYLDLAQRFNYYPEVTIPFLLYNSHFEFESTQAFLVSEGVLGVTSTQDLTMAIPYWGEHQRFIEVMRHESVHQFTIQKVVSRGKKADCSALGLIPLWFIEGIAQHYSLLRLTPDVRAMLAERILVKGGESLPAFWDEGPPSFERIYLLGHAQATFLEESFGEGTLQKILDRSPELCTRASFFGSANTAYGDFPDLVTRVAGVSRKTLEKRWASWVDEIIAPAKMAPHPVSEVTVLNGLGIGEVDSFSLSPDGYSLFYRTFDRDTGISRLYLQDLRDPKSRVQIVGDQSLAVVSLHPLDRRVTAVSHNRIVYIGRRGPSDVIWVQEYKRQVRNGRVRLKLGKRVEHVLSEYDALIEGGYPTIHPASGELAFVGLNRTTGFLDIYAFRDPMREGSPLHRVTDDAYAEQGLTVGRDGEYYFASDATPRGQYEIFRLRDGQKLVLTNFYGEVDSSFPTPASDGSLVFQSSASGFQQAYRRYEDGRIEQISHVPTFLLNPVIEPDGDLLGVMLVEDRRRLVRIREEKLIGRPVTAAAMEQTPVAWRIPNAALKGAQAYNPYRPRNYSLLGAQAAAALGPLAIGQVVFSDKFKDHVVGVTGYYAGSADIAEFALFYMDRSRQIGYGGSTFVTNGLQLKPDVGIRTEAYLLQRIGASFDIEYPFNRYMRLSTSLGPQRLRAYNFSDSGSIFAKQHRVSTMAAEARVGFAFDNTRMSLFGPVSGFSYLLDTSGTMTFGGPDPFGSIESDLHFYYPLLKGYERFVGSARLAGGTSVGGFFRDQYYVPASYNLRAFRETSLQLFGDHYYLTQMEVTFPLSPVVGGALYLQGVVGADIGSVSFEVEDAWENRSGAGVLGTNLGIGPILLRLHFSRPFEIGGREPKNVWYSYLSLFLSPLAGGF